MTYRDPRPHTKIGQVRTALMYLLDQRRRDGALPTSVRFLFYELVMQRTISKSGDRPDKIVSAALIDLRERGLVPWDDIVDETREVFDFTGSATVAVDLLLYLNSACIDPWRGRVPFLLTESRGPSPSTEKGGRRERDRKRRRSRHGKLLAGGAAPRRQFCGPISARCRDALLGYGSPQTGAPP